MTIEIFKYRLAQKCRDARQRNQERMTEEQQVFHQFLLRELRNIVLHPHIQAHEEHWLSRFASRGGDISVEEIIKNIYHYMVEQRGRRVIVHRGAVASTEVTLDVSESYKYFESLYRERRNQRFLTYIGVISSILRAEGQMEMLQRIERIQRNEYIFNVIALEYLPSSVLLHAAAKANYWEVIDSLVRSGGKIDNFAELASQSSREKTEWIQVYKKSYANYVKEELRKELQEEGGSSSSPERRGASSAGSSPSRSSYASNYLR